ncbi:MAG: hypothetical protein Q9170_001944 [Blastenia crenularia]
MLIAREPNNAHALDEDRVLVPSHTPKPLPTHLRAELTSALLSSYAIPAIQSTLYDNARKKQWTEAVRERAKQLIRQGGAMDWRGVVEELVKEAREGYNGRKETKSPAFDGINIRFPEQAVAEGKKVVRNTLEDIVEIEGSGGAW